MNIWWLATAKNDGYCSYNELKYRKVLAQGWSQIGDLRALLPLQNEEMFQYIKKYSPVHNVKSGVNYPATMVTTGDHDDRVVPAHSFKFIATLQEKQTGNNPVLIRIETEAGHGGGKPMSKVIDEVTDVFAFMMYNLGVDF